MCLRSASLFVYSSNSAWASSRVIRHSPVCSSLVERQCTKIMPILDYVEGIVYSTIMDIVNIQISNYLTDIVPDRDEVMQEMEEYARRKDFPIIGPLVGRLLYQLARMTRAKKILEFGSGYGY